MSNIEQGCPNCLNYFSEYNPARQLLNCSHFMCQRCLISRKCCQECGQPIGLNEHFLKDYPIVSDNRPTSSLASARRQAKKHEQVEQNVEEHDQDYDDDHEELLNQSPQYCHDFQEHGQDIDECLLHSKPADLICLQDHAVICSSCALFDKHKGHQVSNREGILNKFATFVEQCLHIYDDIKMQKKQFSSQIYRTQYRKLLQQKKQTDQKRITDKFQALIDTIRIIEKKQLLRLTQAYKDKEKVLQMKQPKIQAIQNQMAKWMIDVEGLGGLMSDTRNLEKLVECVPYIDQKTQLRREILTKGTVLRQKLEQAKNTFSNDLKKQRQWDILKFDQQKIKAISQYTTIRNNNPQHPQKRCQSSSKPPSCSMLPSKSPQIIHENTCRFRSSTTKKQNIKTETDAYEPRLRSEIAINCFNEDNLLLSVENTMICINGDKKDIIFDRIQVAEEVDVQNIPFLSISDIRPVTPVSSAQSSDISRFLHRDKEIKEFPHDNLAGFPVQIAKDDPKKKKKTEFPEKYKGIVDDLRNDRAQTIDLTGAQVGDTSILSLCPFIKKSKKLKTLKLVKNKLTDQCIAQLFQAISQSKIISLNLSQNLLTDKCCNIISCSLISQHLKTITLSLNKVNRRNVKVKIDELGKKNIAILL